MNLKKQTKQNCQAALHTAHCSRMGSSALSNKMHRTICLILLTLTASCNHTVEIISDPPGATVNKQTNDNSKGVLLGQTPLKYVRKSDERGLVLDISAKGYLSKQVVTSHLSGQEKINVKLKKTDRDFLKQEFKKELENEITSTVNRNVEIVVRLQKAVVERDNAEVSRIQKESGENLKDNEIFNSLMYNYHVLRGDYSEAQKFDRRSQNEGKESDSTENPDSADKSPAAKKGRRNAKPPRAAKTPPNQKAASTSEASP